MLLLGSVVLSLITFYWNHRNDVLDRQREDSQFLATMLPYLTSSDPNVRLRSVDVITSRYPDGQMPSQVYRLTAKVVGAESGVNPQRTDETRSIVANVARKLDKQSSTEADAVAVVQQLPPRVYLQIFDEAQRTKAKDIQSVLAKEGLLVPGIENVGKSNAVKETTVRYFNDSDATTAQRVHDTLVNNGIPQALVRRLPLKANPGNIEVWFGGDF